MGYPMYLEYMNKFCLSNSIYIYVNVFNTKSERLRDVEDNVAGHKTIDHCRAFTSR